MSTPFVGQIMLVSFGFAPKGWAFCAGQLLPINQNQALFSLLGTTYGGNGVTTFALPNLQDCSPMHWGQGPGLSSRVLGETAGSDNVTLLITDLPAHSHAAMASSLAPTGSDPDGALLATPADQLFGSAGDGTSFGALRPNGGSQPHPNRQPYLGMYYVVALVGVFPSRD